MDDERRPLDKLVDLYNTLSATPACTVVGSFKIPTGETCELLAFCQPGELVDDSTMIACGEANQASMGSPISRSSGNTMTSFRSSSGITTSCSRRRSALMVVCGSCADITTTGTNFGVSVATAGAGRAVCWCVSVPLCSSSAVLMPPHCKGNLTPILHRGTAGRLFLFSNSTLRTLNSELHHT